MKPKSKHRLEDPSLARFEDIMVEIKDLTDEALKLLPPKMMFTTRAQVYWYATINGCIDGNATMETMEATHHELEAHLCV